ncbi:70 kDa peptidyl-prolyl isomerase-like [Cucumis melo var. makuwa]|uniref:70 kDa peptidyl-prolyl isomerase-like n=1 Tax=Cucumis melo var. makuwa TaxID=1194695 RepID=A0A5A7TX55_CUCMM|nr:70 kDa peptidyl-prolyl isomerase-like [Cucumis melo var. makuwa]TYK28703.1 70 kDa peptidyl-prolyl isomerase-like [Cucumis melo var. makuwa]
MGSNEMFIGIPQNTTLQFDVELLSWHNAKDICTDEGILENILVKEDGREKSKDLDEVLVRYKPHLENGTLISKSGGSNSLLKWVGNNCEDDVKGGESFVDQITGDKKVLKKIQNEGKGYGQLTREQWCKVI